MQLNCNRQERTKRKKTRGTQEGVCRPTKPSQPELTNHPIPPPLHQRWGGGRGERIHLSLIFILVRTSSNDPWGVLLFRTGTIRRLRHASGVMHVVMMHGGVGTVQRRPPAVLEAEERQARDQDAQRDVHLRAGV